jgi:hypothetical protein
MEEKETMILSGRIVAEFEDEAGQFLDGEAEFVEVSKTEAATTAGKGSTVHLPFPCR